MTLAEAMSQARPLLIDQLLPGQEEGNVSFLEQTGSGRYAPEIDTLVRAVATRPPARAIREAPLATWWGSSAKRVAGRILAARADQIAARCQPIRENDSARAGRVIDNPINGERIIIRQSAAETGGQLLAFDLFLPPGAHVPSRHAHPIQEERFSVITGRMRFRLGHRTILANPGDTVAIPAGTAHWFGNVGAGVAQARVEVRPALRMEEVFEAAASLGTMGHFFGTRQPRLSDLALFLLEFQQELAVPDVPAFLVKGFLAPFAWLGRRRSRDTRQGWAR